MLDSYFQRGSLKVDNFVFIDLGGDETLRSRNYMDMEGFIESALKNLNIPYEKKGNESVWVHEDLEYILEH